MSKNYQDIQPDVSMANEPVTTYGIRERRHTPVNRGSNREHVMATTMSVDEYFDKLIEQVHEDYDDPSLFEDAGVELPEGKDAYTPEELRMMLISDLNETVTNCHQLKQ